MTIAPPPARRSSGTAYLHIRNVPVRLTPTSLLQSASGIVSTVPAAEAGDAATLIRAISRPKAETVCATAPWVLVASAISTCRATALPPCAEIDCATACAFSITMSATATLAPSCAKRWAIAPPISPPPPVTSATPPESLPSSTIFAFPLVWVGMWRANVIQHPSEPLLKSACYCMYSV